MPLDLIKVTVISLTGIINIFLAFLVLGRNSKNLINQIFFFISFLYGVWAFCLLFYEFPVIFNSIFWIKATYLVISINEISIMAFAFIFPKPSFRRLWPVGGLYSLFFISLTVYLLFFTDTWVVDVVIDPVKGLHTVIGKNYIWWASAIWGELFLAISIFLLNIKNLQGRNRTQLIYFLSSFSLFGIFATISDIILPIAYNNTSLFSTSSVASLFFTFVATYVIVRHHFLDIRFIVARSVAYIVLLVIIGSFYTGGLFLVSTYLIKQQTSVISLVISTTLTLFVAFTFQSLKEMLERFTDRIFYHSHYDENQVLSVLSHIMSTNIEIRPLVSQTLQSILKEMRISRGALILNTSNNQYEIISEGFTQQLTTFNCCFTFDLDIHKIVVFDDLEEGKLKDSMRVLGISIVKVLHINNDVVGSLILGEKSSGETYAERDLKVFDILSPELSVAIQNAESYEKIKRFNVTLEEEVKKATFDLQKANLRLKELDRLKNDFVSIASHELRTPMTAIRSYLWMALKRPDSPLSLKMEKYLSRAYISTERLINLVNDMLNVSRIESGSIEIKPKEFDIQSLAEEIVSMVLPKAGEKNIKVEVVKSKVPTVFADPDKITQVILNLLGNALKFTPVDGKVSISFFTDGKVVEASIRDNGVGISRDDLAKLFQKFGRLDNSYAAAATSGGTGLGLFISKSLIDLMHGKIWAVSEGTGKGSTFTFTLPVLTPEVLANAEHYAKKPIGEAKELAMVTI
ncbi:MAG: ATP-binding protein [Microgenomates group bacterium]|jgi:signal transduction histidine kinase